MKKALILGVVVVAVIALAAGAAFAGGWWLENGGASSADVWNGVATKTLNWTADTYSTGNWVFEDASGNLADDPYGNNGGTMSTVEGVDPNTRESLYGLGADEPHGGFADTTNYCKTCHAVHEADSDEDPGGGLAWRLLKSGNTTETRTSGEGPNDAAHQGAGNQRSSECMYCHDADTGASPVRPYSLELITTVKGEHTLGSTSVPDRHGEQGDLPDRDPVSYGGNGAELECYQCHTVHGANKLTSWAQNGILRNDPDGSGVSTVVAVDGSVSHVSAANGGVDTGDKTTTKSNFCADCHSANYNYQTGSGYTNPKAESHIQGPRDDGSLEVYGTVMQVATSDIAYGDGADIAVAPGTVGAGNGATEARAPSQGCRGCHSATDQGTGQGEVPGLQSNWPHQTVGPKLLNDALQQAGSNEGDISGVLNDAGRGLSHMDEVCLRCHRWSSTTGVGGGAGDTGVGMTF